MLKWLVDKLILRSTVSLAVLIASQTVALSQTPELIAKFEKGPHAGTVEEAVVAVEVVNTSSDGAAQPPRRVNGLILRCDGFVIAPSDVFELTRTGASKFGDSQTVSVILHPGTPAEKRFPAHRPNWIAKGLGIAVLKVDKFHAPALRTLLPAILKPGDSVDVVWHPWIRTTNRYGPLESRTVHLIAPPVEEKKTPPGLLYFDPPVAQAQSGAIVVGPDRMAVGLLTSEGASNCLSFSVLAQATNCVTPSSVPEGSLDDREAQKTSGDMVRIPGGPIALPAAISTMQPDMYAARVACVAPFSIDKFEVTNDDYFAFWQTLPERQKRSRDFYPVGWAETDPPFPEKIGKVPVLGVPYTGAEAYASSRGERLPTPYEWCLAAYGPRGEDALPEWVHKYLAEREAVWQSVHSEHLEYLRRDPSIDVWQFQQHALTVGAARFGNRAGVIQQTGHVAPLIPFIYLWDGHGGYNSRYMEHCAWSRSRVLAVSNTLFQTWKDPPYVLPVDSRDFDVSPFGAKDMIMNAGEVIAGPPWPPYGGVQWSIEIAWPRKSMSSTRDTPMWPYTDGTPELWRPSNLEPPEPTLSRIVQWGGRRSVESLMARCSFYEVTGMVHPVTGWSLRMVPGTVGQGGVNEWAFPQEERWWVPGAGARVWAQMPAHFHQETGRSIEDLLRSSRGGELSTAILPVGFRCVK